MGASADRVKFGNKVLRWYIENVGNSHQLFPVNPKSPELEGLKAIKSIGELPNPRETSISVITPPHVTVQVLRDAAGLGITKIWLQPGSEDAQVLQVAKELELEISKILSIFNL